MPTHGCNTLMASSPSRVMGCRTACRNKLCVQGPLLLNPEGKFFVSQSTSFLSNDRKSHVASYGKGASLC